MLTVVLMTCSILAATNLFEARLLAKPAWRESEEVDVKDNRNGKSFLEIFDDISDSKVDVIYDDPRDLAGDSGSLDTIYEIDELEGCPVGMKRDSVGICRNVW